jgi:hypothetical protein
MTSGGKPNPANADTGGDQARVLADLIDQACLSPHDQRTQQRLYNSHRPHQGLANARPLTPVPEPITDPKRIAYPNISRRDRLGGILHEYHHAA